MNLFLEGQLDLLDKLISFNVDFIVIGGYSVIYYGYKRTTGDVDIWLKPDNDNKEKLLKVFQIMDIDDYDLEVISGLDFTKHQAFTIGTDPLRTDFMTMVNLVNYEEASNQKVMGEIDGLSIPFIHFNHLILSKMNTGRLIDQADIEKLQKIKREEDKN
ncbi:MAG TPA: nucleotidyltransferase [Saprospiraceae bacterium]|nr:nucleotidyltransferase [Saprospiraceae bacterium]